MIWWALIAGGIAVEFALGWYDEFKQTRTVPRPRGVPERADKPAIDSVTPVEVVEPRSLARLNELTREAAPFCRYVHTKTLSSWRRISRTCRALHQTIIAAFEQHTDGNRAICAENAPDCSLRSVQLTRLLSDALNDRSPDVVHPKLMLAIGALGLTALGLLGSQPLLMLAAFPALFYLCLPFLVHGYHEWTRKRTISIGTLGFVVTIMLLALQQFFAMSVFLTLYYAGKIILLNAQNGAQKQLRSIVGELPRTVWVDINGVELETPFHDLQRGNVVVVHAGEIIPIDGVITAGSGSVDQHGLTGEAPPVEKIIGDTVLAFTMLLDGRLWIRVETTGNETVAAHIADVRNRAANVPFTLQTRGETAAKRTAQPNLALGAVTWTLLGPASATAVLLVSLGYHIRSVAPLSVLNFLNIASARRILVKDGRALEALRKVDMVVFDTSDIVTHAELTVAAIYPCAGYDANDVLRDAATAEFRQTHPIARAILREAQTRHQPTRGGEHALYKMGYGISLTLEGTQIRVGSARFMEFLKIEMPAGIRAIHAERHAQGASLVYVAVNGTLTGAVELHPTMRPELPHIIRALRQRGMRIAILSGDRVQPTARLAQELGIDRFFADILPQQKAAVIAQLQQEGRTVCFVGDGIHDAIALKQANVSISRRGATTIAMDTAQIVLLDAHLQRLPAVFDIAHALDRNIQTLLGFSILPGIIALGGVYLLNFGILTAILIYNVSLLGSIGVAMWPALTHRLKVPAALPPAEREI